MATLSAWKHSDEEILPDYWQMPEYRRLRRSASAMRQRGIPLHLELGQCH